MSIEILDDSCLLRIFREINDKQTLIICSQVNKRWHKLIFPDTNPMERFGKSRIQWDPKNKKMNIMQKTFVLDDWESVAAHYELKTEFLVQHGRKIKQLYCHNMSLDEFQKYVKYLPRLERLHLHNQKSYSSCERYAGPKLERLEILEISVETDERGPHRGLSLMDRCPNLKSAYHYTRTGDYFVDIQVTNYYLQDLVIENMYETPAVTWRTIKKILKKCPNLKHLAIRHKTDTDLEDEDIPEMLELLPKVVLIDLRNSPGVTYVSADYVQEYCRLHNRSISFYYAKEHENDILTDWPHLSNRYARSCHGYSFMVHCFLKKFYDLPSIMDPTFMIPLISGDELRPEAEVEEEDLGLDLFD